MLSNPQDTLFLLEFKACFICLSFVLKFQSTDSDTFAGRTIEVEEKAPRNQKKAAFIISKCAVAFPRDN